MQIATRVATEADWPFALRTHHGGFHDVVIRQFGGWDEAQQDQFFRSAWDEHAHEIITADGHDCGYCVVEQTADQIHVRELVIAPEWQNKGIGSGFLRTVQDRARHAGLPVRLGTFHENRAVVLYRRLGFETFDTTDLHVLMEWVPDRSA